MEKQQFSIAIDAPREKVWNTLWNDDSYPAWTAVFSEGSRAEIDGKPAGQQGWKKGSKIMFLNSKGEGMVSSIAENIPHEYLSIRHLGFIKDGIEDTESEQVKKWAGALENYTLKTVDGNTEVTVDMDITEEYKDYFVNTWPKALDKLKELAEE